MKKKLFPYILIVSIIVQLFAPFSVGVGAKNNLEVVSNKAEAEECEIIEESFTDPVPPPTEITSVRPQRVTHHVKTTAGCIGKTAFETIILFGGSNENPIIYETTLQTISSSEYSFTYTTGEKYCGNYCEKISINTIIKDGTKNTDQEQSAVKLKFNCDTETCNDITWKLESSTGLGETGQTHTQAVAKAEAEARGELPICFDGITGGFKVGGCIAQGFYYLFFKPTSFLFGFTGKALDFTINYSINDKSYRSTFVVEGWGLMRDFCNMFFIFVLLYVAFKTILGLAGGKTKEMIINVVIIGLLINFSLFATQVIIDASNILTRVFYNANTISITTKDANGKIIPFSYNKAEGFPLSEVIVSKVNPVEIITSGKKIESIKIRGTMNNEDSGKSTPEGLSSGTFIIVVLLATAINVVGIIAFLSSALIFITRVIGLWMAMILAPLAFFSYTVPALQDMKMVGWKKWWPETLKLAFLAPVFMFFMYLIIGFMDKGLGIISTVGKTGLSFVIAIIVPFVFIMILLMKAKDIAKDMSGEMGQSITNGITKYGGVAVGAGLAVATGGAAMAMRGTVGRLGSVVANSETLKMAESRGIFGAKTLRNIGSTASKGSMDLRGVKIAGKGLSDTGLKNIGKAKEGGFEKTRADNVSARQKRAKELELGEDSTQTQAVRQAEQALHALKTDRTRQDSLLGLNNGIAFGQVPAAVTAATTNLTAATTARAALPPTATAEEIRLADNAVNEAKDALTSANVADKGIGGLERAITTAERALGIEERALKDAETTLLAASPAQKAAALAAVNAIKISRDGAAATRDSAKNNLEARQATIRNQERPVHIAEDNLKRAENAKIEVNNNRKHDYAHTIQGNWSNTINTIVNLGDHSVLGEREAANKILSGVQESQKITEHH